MKWFFLFIGIIAQSLSATFMKQSAGFSNLPYTLLAFGFWGISFSVFIFALKDFNLSYAFALYAGLGVVLVTLIGRFYLGETISTVQGVSILLIALGVAGLHL